MSRSLLTLGVLVALFASLADARSPNVIIFYADDLGNGDVSFGSARDIQTSHIDALARSGVQLTNYYSAAPICAPSRAALLTGRYPTRAGMSTTRNIPSGMGEAGMSTDEITLAELAKTRDYATAVFGKWHLGSTYDTQPNAQGFDLFFGHHASCIDSYSHMYYASEPYYHDLYRNRTEVWEDGLHMTDLITREAVRFIEANRDRPFLIYASYNTPHYPMVSPGRFLETYAQLARLRRDHVALVAGIEESIGKIMATLGQLDLTRDTLVFFSSDNGAANKSDRGEGGGSNAPFRDYKRSLFDGGIHMPAVVSWPGTVPAGEVRDQLAIAMDVFATVADAIGAKLPADRTIDGKSWMPFLKDPDTPGHETLFFEWDEQYAVRHRQWKLVRNGLIDQDTKGRQNRATGDDFVFLSDVSTDPGEKINVQAAHRELVEQLLEMHEKWRKSTATCQTNPAPTP